MRALALIVAFGLAFGLVGAYLDFRLRKSGQQYIRGQLETWWLKLSYINWYNFGEEEARFALSIIDCVFGKRLFSAKRMIVTGITTVVFSGFLLTLIKAQYINRSEWYTLFDIVTLTWLFFAIIWIAVSFSLTRFFTVAIIKILLAMPSMKYLNFVCLLVLLLFQYFLLVYLSDIINGVLWVAGTTYNIVTQNFPLMDWISIIKFILIYVKVYVVSVITFIGSYKSLSPIAEIQKIFNLFSVHKGDNQPLLLMWHFTDFVDLLPNFIRLSITVSFVGSFFLQSLKEEIMEHLESIIESDKPVFTLVCGGGAR